MDRYEPYGRIVVPADSLLNSCTSTEWGTRPSRITHPPTPLWTACTAVCSFGIMPPAATPSSINPRARLPSISAISCFSPSNTPAISVHRRKRWAPRASAIAPAAVSALTLNVAASNSPSPAATGAITGTIPASRRTERTSVFTFFGSPTNPSCPPCTCSATRRRPSFPESPTAGAPALEISFASALLIFPERTISAASIVCSQVTLSPLMKFVSILSLSRNFPIWGPPPWTTTGRSPSCFNRTMSLQNWLLSSSLTIAWPPYLITSGSFPSGLAARARAEAKTSLRTVGSRPDRASPTCCWAVGVVGRQIWSVGRSEGTRQSSAPKERER
mmetsp:Transcript_45885/g.90382  ORF Transcript_45885/g.90382 Transcript_45885/m.90382 type:complete len:331 (+) Transcript_45885:276-1268(+)